MSMSSFWYILEVNIRGRKLSNFRFEFGDFNSKLIHFLDLAKQEVINFCWIFRKTSILRILIWCVVQFFFEMNSFCLRVTAKKMTRHWWQKWVIIFCCQQFPSEKTYWHLITHHGHVPCHFSFKSFQNFLIIAVFPIRFF